MQATDIVDALKSFGWEAEIVKPAHIGGVVSVNGNGLFKCVDGRLSDHKDQMRGPKTLGGVYAIAATRGTLDQESLAAIVDEVRAAGYVPSCHGDAGGAMGCGFFKLWSKGELTDLAQPAYNADEGKDTVIKSGGVYETLIGEHKENSVLINTIPKTTIEPKDAPNMDFIVDAWIAGEFQLDVGRYLTLAAETVKKLNGPLKAKIIVQ